MSVVLRTAVVELSNESDGTVVFEYNLDGTGEVLVAFLPNAAYTPYNPPIYILPNIDLSSMCDQNEFFSRSDARMIWESLVREGFKVV